MLFIFFYLNLIIIDCDYIKKKTKICALLKYLCPLGATKTSTSELPPSIGRKKTLTWF